MELRDFIARRLQKPAGPRIQIYRIMKLTVFIVLAACLHVSAAARAQKVTLKEKDVPLQKVFREIYAQTGYEFFYDDDLMSKARPVSLDVKEASIEMVLALCFRDQP